MPTFKGGGQTQGDSLHIKEGKEANCMLRRDESILGWDAERGSKHPPRPS